MRDPLDPLDTRPTPAWHTEQVKKAMLTAVLPKLNIHHQFRLSGDYSCPILIGAYQVLLTLQTTMEIGGVIKPCRSKDEVEQSFIESMLKDQVDENLAIIREVNRMMKGFWLDTFFTNPKVIPMGELRHEHCIETMGSDGYTYCWKTWLTMYDQDKVVHTTWKISVTDVEDVMYKGAFWGARYE